MSYRRWLLLVLTMLWAGACRQDEEPGPVPDRESGTARFAPPADGRLTPEQVEMYLAVREATLPAAAASDDPLDFARLASLAKAELEAAEARGYDPEEYQWVKGRIAEARLPALDAVLSRIAESLGTEPAKAASAEKDVAGRTARAYNEELLVRYDEDLNALARGAATP